MAEMDSNFCEGGKLIFLADRIVPVADAIQAKKLNQTTEYIADMLDSLNMLTDDPDLELLYYLIDVAAKEAKAIRDRTR